MVNFSDPTVIAQRFLALVKLWHTVDGLVIWEFLTTLSYEWSIVQGRRPYRWTIWIHSLTRVAALAAVITNIVSTDVTTPINCQAAIITQFMFAYMSLAAASLLIVLRIIAIWNRNKLMSALASTFWFTNVSFLVHGVVRIRAEWAPEQDSCAVLNIESTKLAVIVALVTNVALFLIMLYGLLRLGIHGGGTFILGRFLWKQGVVWFMLATVAEVPSAVFICLNLNDPLDVMFQFPCLVTMSIAASRMYRSLTDFVSSDVVCETPQNIASTSTIKGTPIVPNLFNHIEVVMHSTYEEYPRSRMHQFGPYINTDKKLPDKPYILSIDNGPRS